MKKDKFTLFLEQSQFESPILNQASLLHVSIDVSKKMWTFHVQLSQVIAPEMLMPFIANLKTYFFISRLLSTIDVDIKYESLTQFQPYALAYFDFVLIELSKEKARYLVLKNFKVRYDQETYFIAIDKDSTYIEDYLPDLKEAFKRFGFYPKIELEVVESLIST